MDANVRFWLRVYTEWPTNRYAIHDDERLEIVYRVVAANSGHEASVKRAKAEIEAALARLDQKRPASERGLTGADLEVFRALAGSADPRRFARARGHVRHQKGQRDRMAEALRESGRYRQQMEAIFDEYRLPRELLAIAFVESMFNLQARSWSGALGIWQFLKGTGREYMNLNAVVDERRDPLVSTHAAANYLRASHKRLGAWPVAITSYNYGNNGMARAVQACGTTDLPTIFRCYRKGSMGFAAKNYYTEFLAALQVLRRPEAFFSEVTPRSRWRYDLIRLPAAVAATELVRTRAISASDLAA
ncbi:MAG: lytic transglycosylase domain-containing protein, partial [Deltaproteobacteria bacterium]|nr:lytic transglycosylase domain-containing protein [Deltaproteobacteria bacterium]